MDEKARIAVNQDLQAELSACQQEVEMLRSNLEISNSILNAVDAIALVFNPEGHIIRCNASFGQITDCMAEATHKPFWELFCNQHEKESVKAVFKRVQQDKIAIAHQHDWTAKNSSSFGVAWKYIPSLDSDGAVKYVIGIGNDITAKTPAEHAIQERVAQLEAQNRLLEGRVRILEATASAANALLTLENFDSAVNTALQIIGESLDCDHVAILKDFAIPSSQSLGYFRVLHEWDSPYALSQISHPESSQIYYDSFEELYQLFSQGYSDGGLIDEIPEPLRTIFKSVGIKSTYSVPIFVDGKFWGIVGFDNCCETKCWSPSELAVLKIAADCIGSAIGRDRSQKAIFKAEQERSAELTKANEVLKKSLDALAADPDLNRFLGHVLKVIAQELDAPVVEHWFNTEGNIAYLNLSCCRGELLTPEQQALDPRVQGIKIPPLPMHHHDLLHRQRYVIVEDLVSNPIQVSVFDPISFDLAAWSAEYGISKYIYLPLIIGERSIGTLCVYISCDRTFTGQQIELICVLAQQVTLAMQLTQLAEEAKLAAIAREQEKAATERAAELAKANNALQAIIDTLGTLGSLDDFVPAALKIVSCTFGTNSCAFYEHSIDNFIYLRYWALENHVLHPKDLLELDQEKFAFVRRLAEGAEVPLAYVGDVPLRARKHTLILNHLTGTVVPEFDTFIQTHGWELELNLPLVINDVAEAALCIYRSAAKPFTTNEIALAEALGKQLALALQSSRLAEEAKQAAIAREQEKAATERAAELAKANEALLQRDHLLSTVAEISKNLLESAEVDSAIAQVLRQLGEAAGISRVTLMQQELEAATARLHHRVLVEWTALGVPRQIDEPASKVVYNDEYGVLVDELQAGRSIWHMSDEFPEPARTQQKGIAVKSTGAVPIFIEGSYYGCVAFDDCVNYRQWSAQEIDVLAAGAGAIGAALHRKQLVDRLIEERARAATERAAELAKANEVLRRIGSQLVGQQDLNHFLESVLFEVTQEIGAVNTSILLYDRKSNTLLMHSVLHDGQAINLETDPRFEIWKTPVPANITQAWKQIQSRGYRLHDLDDDDATNWSFSVPWHRMMGHCFITTVCLQVGDETLGFIRMCFRERVNPSVECIELLQALADQTALAIQLTRLAEEAKLAAKARAEEAKQAAILEERNRIAREIHDTLAQAFTGVIIQLEATKRKISNAQLETAQTHINRARSLAVEGLSEARHSVQALRPEPLESRHLTDALCHFAEQMTGDSATQITVGIEGRNYALPVEIETNLLRIAQEAVTNALRHAQAQTIHIKLRFETAAVHLQITDDGQGFDPESQLMNMGFGLIGMQERSQRLGGEFTLTTNIGQGTKIIVTVLIPAVKSRTIP